MTTEFKTVDSWIENHIKVYRGSSITVSDQKVCENIILYYCTQLLDVLNLDTNEPSKYDLLLIHYVVDRYKWADYNHKKIFDRILDIYRRR